MHKINQPIRRIIVIAGPTASGKSDAAITLAHHLNGEVISADSRQVYRGMDIGTGKVTRDAHTPPSRDTTTETALNFFSQGIRHHLIDIANPNEEYNISHFLRDARSAIDDIYSRSKQPILCGGTHFWIQALLENTALPSVPPDPVFRETIAQKTNDELFALLETQDPKRAKTIDRKNPFRLMRALEIVNALGAVPPLTRHPRHAADPDHAYAIMVLNPPKDILHQRIRERLLARFEIGMIDEVIRLHAQGTPWERLESFGLEYRFVAQFLQEKIDRTTLYTELEHAIWHYAKRQLSWLRRWERSGATLTWRENPTPDLIQTLSVIPVTKEPSQKANIS